jgi:hypothetical protein
MSRGASAAPGPRPPAINPPRVSLAFTLHCGNGDESAGYAEPVSRIFRTPSLRARTARLPRREIKHARGGEHE